MNGAKSKEESKSMYKESNSRKQQMKLELYKQNIDRKMGSTSTHNLKFETIDDRIVFYRFLGHLEIQDSHHWKMDTRCWI